jgi:hypothetical protein
MSRTNRALLTALASMLAIVAIVGIASARTLRVDEPEFEWAWTERTPFTIRYGGREIGCPLTLRGNFNAATIAKSLGRGIAVLREKAEAPERCPRGSMLIVSGIPALEVRYEGFEGTLPNITGIRVSIPGMRYLVREFIVCEYLPPAERPLRATIARAAGSELTTVTPESGTRFESTTPLSCPPASFSGAGTVTRWRSANRIRMTLI